MKTEDIAHETYDRENGIETDADMDWFQEKLKQLMQKYEQ